MTTNGMTNEYGGPTVLAGGALLGAMPAGGGTSQTAVNRRAGARSQISAIVTAAVSLLAMLLLAPLIGLLPQATLKLMQGVGHMAPVTHADRVNPEIAAFLRAQP